MSHMYRHIFTEGIGLRQLLDYYMLLKACDEMSVEDKQFSISAIEEFKMKRFACGIMWILQEVFGLERDYLLFEPNEKEGRFLLDDIMKSGNFGKMDERYGDVFDSKLKKVIGAIRRSLHLVWHYPSEALWTPVYYAWHFCWKRLVK